MKRLLFVAMLFTSAGCGGGSVPQEAATPADVKAEEATPNLEETPLGDTPATAHELLQQVVESNPVLTELWAREAGPLAEHSLEIEDGDGAVYDLKVLAAVAPVPKTIDETHQKIDIDIGSQTTLSCTFSTQRVDGAATLRNIVEGFAVDPQQQLPAAVNVDVMSGAPVVWMDVGYVVESAGEMRMGDAKVYMVVLPFSALWCVHDQMGYRQTVLKNIETMAASLMKSSEAMYTDELLRRHVAVMSLSGQAMGFSEERILTTEEGLQTYDYTLTFMTRGPGAYAAEDSYETELADKDGFVVSQTAVTVENGEITLHMEMKRNKDGSYRASGTFQGKPIEADLGLGYELLGSFAEEEKLRKFTAENEDGASMMLHSYSASMAPDQIIPIKIELMSAKDRQLKADMMGLEMISWSNERGRALKSMADLGTFKIEIDLKYANPDR